MKDRTNNPKLSSSYYIYSADVLSAYRDFQKKVHSSPLMTLWFFILLFFAIGVVLRVVYQVQHSGNILPINVDVYSLFAIIFVFFLAKSSVDIQRLLIQNREMLFVFTQPIKIESIFFGKFITVFCFNLGLFAAGSGIFTLELLVFNFVGYPIQFDGMLFVQVLFLTLLGITIGTALGVFAMVQPWKRKIIYMFIGSIPVTALYFTYRFLNYFPPLIIFILLGMSFVILFGYAPDKILTLWNNFTTPKEKTFFEPYNPKCDLSSRFIDMFALFPFITGRMRIIAKKELFITRRSKELFSTAIVGVFITFLQYGAYQLVGDFRQYGVQNLQVYIYPIVIAFCLYVAASLLLTTTMLSAIGKENDNFWIVKSVPQSGFTFVSGKALFAFIYVPYVLIVAVPIPLLIYQDVFTLSYYILSALTVSVLYIGLGAYFGAKYPNFSEAKKGEPDVMLLYSVLMITLIVSVVLIMPTFFVFLIDKILGIILIVYSLDWALFIGYYAIHYSGRIVDRMEA